MKSGLKKLHKEQKRHRRLIDSTRRGDRLRGYVGMADEFRYAWESEPENYSEHELDYLKQEELSCRKQLISLSTDSQGNPKALGFTNQVFFELIT